MKLLSLWTYIMTMLLRLSLITLCIYLLSSWLVQADVWFIEAEGFEEKRSILATNQKGVNVQWSIKEDDKKALGKKYLTVEGANRNNCEACAPLFYPISNIRQAGLYKLWSRCIMPTTASDSFFWRISNDGGKAFTPPAAAHGGDLWEKWHWKRPWEGIQLKKGKANILLIAERENRTKLDAYCLRNDGKTPTDEEAAAWFKENRRRVRSVEAQQKLTLIWGQIRQL